MTCSVCTAAGESNVWTRGTSNYRKDKLSQHNTSSGHVDAKETLKLQPGSAEELVEQVRSIQLCACGAAFGGAGLGIIVWPAAPTAAHHIWSLAQSCFKFNYSSAYYRK